MAHPLAPSNFAHSGTCSAGDDLTHSLMTCIIAKDGTRLDIDELVFAMIADLGYPLNAVYHPGSNDVQVGISVDGTMFGVRLRWDPASSVFEVIGASASRRASSDVAYDVATGTLTIPALIAGTAVYSLDLKLVGVDPFRLAVTRRVAAVRRNAAVACMSRIALVVAVVIRMAASLSAGQTPADLSQILVGRWEGRSPIRRSLLASAGASAPPGVRWKYGLRTTRTESGPLTRSMGFPDGRLLPFFSASNRMLEVKR
jgi:hypothetical protein